MRPDATTTSSALTLDIGPQKEAKLASMAEMEPEAVILSLPRDVCSGSLRPKSLLGSPTRLELWPVTDQHVRALTARMIAPYAFLFFCR